MSDLSFVWLEVTGKCQLQCTHCYAESGPSGTHGKMGTADWIRVIDQAADLDVTAVQFIGGEPTLHPDLVTLGVHALDRGLQVEVFSNLVHVRPALWDLFSAPGVSLATSYYSDDPIQHEAITRSAGQPCQDAGKHRRGGTARDPLASRNYRSGRGTALAAGCWRVGGAWCHRYRLRSAPPGRTRYPGREVRCGPVMRELREWCCGDLPYGRRVAMRFHPLDALG